MSIICIATDAKEEKNCITCLARKMRHIMQIKRNINSFAVTFLVVPEERDIMEMSFVIGIIF